MSDLFEISHTALKTAADGTFKNGKTWLLLALLAAIIYYITGLFSGQMDVAMQANSTPGIILTVVAVLLALLGTGVCIKTLRNETPNFKHFGRTFKEGVLFTIISLIYTILLLVLVGFVIFGVATWGALLKTPVDILLYFIAITICWLLLVVLIMMIAVITIPAALSFARTGKFSAAFKLTNLLDMIHEVTWKKCVLGILLQTFVTLVLATLVVACAYLLTWIPAAGDVLGAIFAGLFVPFVVIYYLNFCTRLFEVVKHE